MPVSRMTLDVCNSQRTTNNDKSSPHVSTQHATRLQTCWDYGNASVLGRHAAINAYTLGLGFLLLSITADKSSNVFRLSHTLVENSKEQWIQSKEACTHPARARGADKYAGTSLTPGMPDKISALCLSLSLSRLSLPLSFSLTCVFPTDTPLSSPPSHLHAYRSVYPSKTKESKKLRRRCAYEYAVGLGRVVRNRSVVKSSAQ